MIWDAVEEAVGQARAIAWDGCHKIYLAMDEGEVATFRSYGYGEDGSHLLPLPLGPEDPLAVLRMWWDASCSLRFISAVETVEGDPNKGFTHLIRQFEDEDEAEDEEPYGWDDGGDDY